MISGRPSKVIASIPGARLAVRKCLQLAYRFHFRNRDREIISGMRSISDEMSQIASVLDALTTSPSREEREAIEVIEQQRERLLNNHRPLVDGEHGEPGLYDGQKTVSEACKVSKDARSALMLYRLVRKLKPKYVLELGTNMGLSSAYIGMALEASGDGKLITLEASPYRLAMAKDMHRRLGLECIDYVQGLFSDTLADVLGQGRSIDLAFIDGHHQYEPTLEYFDQIQPSMRNGRGIVAFDDIRWSPGMFRAWNELRESPLIDIAVDLDTMGICTLTKGNIRSGHRIGPVRILRSWAT